MKIEEFIQALGISFYTGVPDSQLKALCNYLMATYGLDPQHHLIGANEGNCAALAAGYHLATGKLPAIYLQNSGEGNIINPVASLLHPLVYGIPALFIIGWRGEPGVLDEPQHIYQGGATLKLLTDMELQYIILDEKSTPQALSIQMDLWKDWFAAGHQAAVVVRQGALQGNVAPDYTNPFTMTREEAIVSILQATGSDLLISSTGKASREVFEARERLHQSHQTDFLTVGSMGHSSSIALGIATQRPQERIWCLDGDGAALMHLGAMATIGAVHPRHFIHLLINNYAHESVGGMPTVSSSVQWCQLALACGYDQAESVEDLSSLSSQLAYRKAHPGLSFLEIRCANGARSDLGRPTTTPQENKKRLMERIQRGTMESEIG